MQIIFNNRIKIFTVRQNIIFLSFALFIVWIWMLISALVDRGNDRGFLTIFGYIIITSLVFSFFLSGNNKIVDFFRCFVFLGLSSLVIFVVGFIFGFYIINTTGLSWTGLIVPILSTGFFIFYFLRRLISFPNNAIAFWVVLSLPLFLIIILSLPIYDSTFDYEYGIGFPISIYLSLLFISISILCSDHLQYKLTLNRSKNKTEVDPLK